VPLVQRPLGGFVIIDCIIHHLDGMSSGKKKKGKDFTGVPVPTC